MAKKDTKNTTVQTEGADSQALDVLAIQEAEVVEETTSADDQILKMLEEMGVDTEGTVDVVSIILPPEQESTPVAETKKDKKEKKTPKEPKAEGEAKEPKTPKKESLKIPMDAPIPVRQFRGLQIGVYGNILEELEEPDAKGFRHQEIKLEKFNQSAHEAFRNQVGRMVLVVPKEGSTYMVVAEDKDGNKEPVLEVTNKGRGCLRCRQIAQALQLAYNEKDDKVILESQEYLELQKQLVAVMTPVTAPVVTPVDVKVTVELQEVVGA